MRPRRLLAASLVLAGLSVATVRAAGFLVPGYELVYSYPVETTLAEPDLRRAVDVWPEMFSRAKKTIDIEEFYITPSTAPGEALEASLQALERAAKRGVKIRVMLEKKFEKNSLDGIARLRSIPGLELRIIDWSGINGDGIVHAKFFTVDGARAYVGSQNFDWRSLKHIHELGLAIDDGPVVAGVQSIFDHDWGVAATTGPAPSVQTARPAADRARRAYLVASPWRLNPPGVGDSESELVRLLDEATGQAQIQLLDYSPLTRGKPRRFYAVLDNAIRDAAVRGGRVQLLVSHWNTDEPAIRHLQSLAVLPNIEVRIASIPESKDGPIPFARVLHSKYLVVDGKTLWLGTSNWGGGYLNASRNLELVIQDESLAARVAKIHTHLWTSPYAAPVDILKTYPKPKR